MAIEQTLPPPQTPSTIKLVSAIRSGLEAKRARLLKRPIIGLIGELGKNGRPKKTSLSKAWRENSEGESWSVRISIDYEGRWKDQAQDVLGDVRGIVEQRVTFLTEEHEELLEEEPAEFLKLNPRPPSAEVISFRTEPGTSRVMELELAERPDNLRSITAVAIVPNLVQVDRQLEALKRLEAEPDDSPLAPLRALIGLGHRDLDSIKRPENVSLDFRTNLDPSQKRCIQLALETPHFAVIQGPPGSGKTTIISEIVRVLADQGGRILLVSSTHSALDKVVEKLVQSVGTPGPDDLSPHTLPNRFATKAAKLTPIAQDYWMSARRGNRGSTIAARLEKVLRRRVPDADAIFDKVDPELQGQAPLSQGISHSAQVVCGTPIGLISCAAVRDAAPAGFDLLIVDEVSKMTVPEFLAIAVKARRWILVGDPEQLPPYQEAVEASVILGQDLAPEVELACSVASYYARMSDFRRRHSSLLVVARNPARAIHVIREQLAFQIARTDLPGIPKVLPAGSELSGSCVLVCSPRQVRKAAKELEPIANHDRAWADWGERTQEKLKVLIQADIEPPSLPPRWSLVREEHRARASLLDQMFSVYHAKPWTAANNQMLELVSKQGLISRLIPCDAAVAASSGIPYDPESRSWTERVRSLAAAFAVNSVSVFDWLAGIPEGMYDMPPLGVLHEVLPSELVNAVKELRGVLEMQYRMHPSLSALPRRLFYRGRALRDGVSGQAGCRVRLVSVISDRRGEENEAEVEKVMALLGKLDEEEASRKSEKPPEVMVLSPYNDQVKLLKNRLLEMRGKLPHLGRIDQWTLDSCQGREADHVIISLVRSRSNDFFDLPKRWNVALTRAQHTLTLVGDIQAYLREAQQARGRNRRNPTMSLLARIVEEYHQQVRAAEGAART